MGMITTILLQILSSKAVIDLIAKGVNKLVESKTHGITHELAEILVEAISKSRLNTYEKENGNLVKK